MLCCHLPARRGQQIFSYPEAELKKSRLTSSRLMIAMRFQPMVLQLFPDLWTCMCTSVSPVFRIKKP